MVYIRMLLGGESSSVACGWVDISGSGKKHAGENSTYASVTVHRQKMFGVTKQNDRQFCRTDAAVDSVNVYMCMSAQHGWCASPCICEQPRSCQSPVIGQIKAKF